MVRGKYYPNQGLSKWAEKMQFLLCVRMGSNLVQQNVGFMYFASFYIFLSVHQVPTHCTRLILRTISCSLQCRYRRTGALITLDAVLAIISKDLKVTEFSYAI